MSDTSGKKKKKKKKANPWVENIESLVVAVILALIIRTFVVEAFIIPTGSMASTLYGNHLEVKCPNCGYTYAFGFNAGAPVSPQRVRCPNCGENPGVRPYVPGRTSKPRHSGGDKILVNKIPYLLDGPSRWDPFVFVNPNASRNDNPPKTTYIKRLVGMPGETLEILRGDIVVDGKIQRKTESAQTSLWMPVYDINYVWKKDSAWALPTAGWSLDGKRLVAACPEGDLAWVRYKGRIGDRPDEAGIIHDTYGYDHDLRVWVDDGVKRGAGLNVVTDLRLAFDLQGTGTGRLELSLPFEDDEAGHDDRAVLDLAAGTAAIVRDGKTLTSADLPTLVDGKKHHIVFHRLDYLLVLAIDGREPVEYSVWDDAEYHRRVETGEVLGGWRRSGIRIGAAGVNLELTDLKIDRDVYYTYAPQGRPPKHYYARQIPKGYYFAMGDNSPESYDSRYWAGKSFVPRDHLIGKGLVIWWHPMRLRVIR